MRAILIEIDKLLRGELFHSTAAGAERVAVPIRIMVLCSLLFGAIYGVCMGVYGGMNRGWDGTLQLVASAVKVPLLFMLTLLVTFPSLYVFSSLLRSQLRMQETLRLLTGAIAVNLTVLASLGPVVAFFTLSTRSYPFMVLLNVLMFTVAGAVGLGFLVRMLRSVFASGAPVVAPGAGEEEGTRRPEPDRARWVFRVWLFIFAVVGAQMGWILRPFIGHPDLPFELFREQWSNFFAAVISMLRDLLG